MSPPRSLYRCRTCSNRVGRASACTGSRHVVFVAFAHSCSDAVGAGVVELLENCQCALPGDLGGLRIAECLVRVAQGDKDIGFAVTVAELAVQVDGPLVAGCGFLLVAKMAVGVTQAVVCLGLAEPISDLPLQVEGLLAAVEGLSVVT